MISVEEVLSAALGDMSCFCATVLGTGIFGL